MKRDHMHDMTVEQLLDRYVAIGVDQDRALVKSEHAKFNRLFDEMDAIENELRDRGDDQRHALLRLYDHPNAQVRLNSMKATLALSPEAARRALETLAGSQEYPQAGDAGMTLYALDNGIFKPT